jgi:tetratricopeptide (TPR) repeat protein
MKQTLTNLYNWLSENLNGLLVAIIAAVIAGIILLIIQQIISRNKHKKKLKEHTKDIESQKQEWRKLQLRSIPPDFERHYPNENYIQPYFTFVKPKKGKENKQLLGDYFLKDVFINATKEDKLYLLLGDTGTGKTAALVHLYADYINCHTEQDYAIRILSLKHSSVFEEIERISNKTNCILLLDAMDENPMAQNPNKRTEFDNKINKICQDFAFVIITCRPQFFPDEDSESNQVQASRGDTTTLYTRLELSDFDETQVNEFLNLVFPSPTESEKREKAKKIVNNNILISIRPLVLTYIKDIVESRRDINTTFDFYDNVVYEHIKREIKKTPHNNLEEQTQIWWNITSEIALFIYQNRTLKYLEPEITSEELITICKRINPNDYNSFLSSQGISISHETGVKQPQIKIDENIFLHHSLLTRTGNAFHFSHKSFYEYFMAYRFLQHPKEIKQVYSMDFALQIYNGALQAWSEQKDTPFSKLKKTRPYTVAFSLNRIGNALYGINHFSEAERYYQHALVLFRQLEEVKNDTYKDDIAMVLNNLAGTYWKTNHLDNAIKKLNEALTIRRQLADKHPDAYLPNVAMTLNNLANLHKNTNQLDKAEEEYNEALTTYRQLADKNPDAYLPYVATTLNNLANLHSDTNQLDKAEEEYNEALTTYRQLADKNPDAYLPYVATTLNNLANLYKNTKRYNEAEEEYNKALTIRRQLADKNPDVYLPYVADSLENLAILHCVTNRLQDAEEEYKDVLSIRQKIADSNPDAYLHKVAQTLFNMALLYLDRKEYDSAEAAALESLEKYHIMAEKSHAAFDRYVKKADKLLEDIRKVKEADA